MSDVDDYDLFIHGLNTRQDYDFLSPARNAMPIVRRLEGLRWLSTGTVRGDVFNMTRLHGQVLFEAQREFDRILDRNHGIYPRHIIAHSMGQIITANIYVSPDTKIVTVGGPMTHPLWGRWMRMMGLFRRDFPNNSKHFVNPLDPICALQRGFWTSSPGDVPGGSTHRIPPPKMPFEGNHHHISVYLHTQAVRGAIK